jgi:hypothetical protein
MRSTDGGMEIVPTKEQSEKAKSPRIETLESLSKVRTDSLLHPEKHEFEMIRIDEGRQSDRSDEQSEKADSPSVET